MLRSGSQSFLALSILAFFSLLFSGPAASEVQAEEAMQTHPIPVQNPASDLWREVRQREMTSQGKTQVKSVDSSQFMDIRGEDFRDYRVEYLIPYAPYAMAAVLVLLASIYIVRGRIPIHDGRSGQTIKRFEEADRVIHWFLAILFLFLAITGLVMMIGRLLFLPLFGHEVFSVIANICKRGHDLFGPLFLIGIVLMLVRFASKNIPSMMDLKWLLRAGGLFGGGHPSAGYFNGGEKAWFWLVMLVGLLISVTGFILLFPNFEQGREVMQTTLMLHGLGALLLIIGSFGHMYIGSVGMEGSLDSMKTGYVDTNWARQHHDLWHQEVMQQTAGNTEGMDAQAGKTAGT